jgi:hypothetical protein
MRLRHRLAESGERRVRGEPDNDTRLLVFELPADQVTKP